MRRHATRNKPDSGPAHLTACEQAIRFVVCAPESAAGAFSMELLDILPDGVLRDLVYACEQIRRGEADAVEVRRTKQGEWLVQASRETYSGHHSP